jgi:hypothetical protein
MGNPLTTKRTFTFYYFTQSQPLFIIYCTVYNANACQIYPTFYLFFVPCFRSHIHIHKVSVSVIKKR